MSPIPWKQLSNKSNAILLALVAAWPLFFYWRAFLGLGMFYFGDIARFFYPTRVLYANALRDGRLPLWAPQILAGFPLFAEMQTGALYPPHLLLYRLLPIDLAINFDILFHLSLLGAGMYLFARARGISSTGSAVSAFALSAGGFGVGRVTHMSVIAVAAWLPVCLLVYERWRQSPRFRWFLLLVTLFALQLVAGHPQFMLLNILTFCAYAGATALNLLDSHDLTSRQSSSRRVILALIPVLSLALAACIAAVQLLPTLELAQSTARSGGVDESFFTQFSYHPLLLALLLDPFVLGNPYPRVSVEVLAYVGIMPLLLALSALLFRRSRNTFFWVVLALASLALALGSFDPAYSLLRYLPVINLFRVPARFLFPMMVSLAVLSGIGYDALRSRVSDPRNRMPLRVAVVIAVLIVTVVITGPILGVDRWVAIWEILSPFLFAASLLILIRAARGQLNRPLLSVLVLGITIFDLACFGTVYAETFNVIGRQQDIFSRPRVMDTLDLAAGARIFTSQWIFPWISVMRESLYPNLNAAYNVRGAEGYTPLIPLRTDQYLANLSPAMLDLLNVRYYLIPQVLPVDAQSEGADLHDPFLPDPVNNAISIPATPATGLKIESSLAQSVDLSNGTVIATVELTTLDRGVISIPLRVGIDTAEWAYERSDVRRTVKHSEPQVASTFPAVSAFPPESHVGHTYLANIMFSKVPLAITRIRIVPLSNFAAGLIYVQSLKLTDGASIVDLATLVGKADHRLIYRSEDVAVFENHADAPPAFLTHNAYPESDDAALKLLQSPDFSGELLLAAGASLAGDEGQRSDESVTISSYEPEHVTINAVASADAYLVLTDAWDPGWVVTVDGQPDVIRRADVMFRAVRIPAGAHRVEFFYRPRSFYVGALLSLIGLASLALITVSSWLFVRKVL